MADLLSLANPLAVVPGLNRSASRHPRPGLCPGLPRLLLAVVYWASGLKGPWLPMWCVMAIASAVCVVLGLLFSIAIRSWQIVAVAAVASFVLMTVLGGWFWSLPRSGPPVTWAMSAHAHPLGVRGTATTRGTLSSLPANAPGAAADDHDSAEDYFPAESLRMGPGADLTALGIDAGRHDPHSTRPGRDQIELAPGVFGWKRPTGGVYTRARPPSMSPS